MNRRAFLFGATALAAAPAAKPTLAVASTIKAGDVVTFAGERGLWKIIHNSTYGKLASYSGPRTGMSDVRLAR